jgi:hypothetical protein
MEDPVATISLWLIIVLIIAAIIGPRIERRRRR